MARMNIERWRRIRELSEQAAARPAPERAQWLALVEPDAALRARALELESGKNCRREPIWGPSVSAWCYPSGVCNDLVIKGYETVCD